MKWKRYRIVTDGYAGYEVQHRYLFWPVWIQTQFCNTHLTIDDAKKYIEGQKNKVVYEEH